MTTTAPPQPCDTCGDLMWPVNQARRCRACRFAYTPPETIDQRIARKDAYRKAMPARLAAIRAERTAKQQRAMGVIA